MRITVPDKDISLGEPQLFKNYPAVSRKKILLGFQKRTEHSLPIPASLSYTEHIINNQEQNCSSMTTGTTKSLAMSKVGRPLLFVVLSVTVWGVGAIDQQQA